MRRSPLCLVPGAFLLVLAACSGDAQRERLTAPQLPEVAFDAAGEGGASLEAAWVRTDRDDYLPGDTVTITGGGWQPGETVVMTLTEDPELHDDRVFISIADDAGFFANREFIVEEHHFGVSFVLTAVGELSGDTAVTMFTDGRVIQRVELAPGVFCEAPPEEGCTIAAPLIVAPGASINAVVTVRTNNDQGTGSTNWRNTGWVVSGTGGGTLNCSTVPNPDVSGVNATHTGTVPITAPTTPGIYAAAFQAFQGDCPDSGMPSLLFTLTNAIQVVAANTAPDADAGGPYTGDEGSPIQLDGTGSDADAGDVLTFTWNEVPDGPCTFDDATLEDPTITCPDNGTFEVSLTVSDGTTTSVSMAQVSVANVEPVVDVGADETLAGMALSRNGSFTDPGTLDTWTATVNYGDGGATVALTLNADRTFALSHTYATSGTYTVEVCVTDDDAGKGCDSAEITVENTAPVVSAGADATIDEGQTFAQGGSFTDPDADAWTATVDYGDGSGEQDLTLDPDKTFALSHPYADDTGGPFTVSVCVSDGAAEACDTVMVTVNNVAPVVDAGGGGSIDEGGTFSSSGSFTDPGADMWTGTVDYGEGGVMALALNADKTFALSHTYDNDGTFTVTVCVSDGDGGQDCDDALVTVSNVAPAVDAGPDAMVNEGAAFSQNGSFTDPGADPWTATVDYGDGDGVQPLALIGKTFALGHTYADDDTFTVSVCVKDDDETVCDEVTVIVKNVDPVVDAGTGATIDENATFTGGGSFTDPGADTWTATVDYGDGGSAQDLTLSGKTFSLSHKYLDNGVFTVSVCVTDDDGGSGCNTLTVTVENVAPVITALMPEDGAIFPISQPVVFTGTFTDPGTLDTHTCSTTATAVGLSDVTGTVGTTSGTCMSTLSFTEAGVYTVTYTVSDKDNESDSLARMIVVYDPSAGFVTGGGWIDSPAGAYVPNPGLGGKANFGFVSKYKKGANVPTGNTEFQFHAGGLNFHSSSYQWLVVNQNGSNAQFKGTGTVNGQAGFGFMLWAADGGKSGTDTFRMKIWVGDDESAVVYDNGVSQSIASGSIVIHTGKN